MLISISIFISLELLVILIESNSNRQHKVSFFLAALFIVLLMGCNKEIADASNYEYRYVASAQGWSFKNAQWAQQLFGYICNQFGLSFTAYRILYYGIGVTLICCFVHANLGYSIRFLAFYMAFPMIIDAAQMKNFMAMSIVTFALNLLGGTKRYKNILFVALILLAAGFQVVAFAYLPLIIFCNIACHKKYRIISCFPILLFAALFTNKNAADIIAELVLENTTEGFSGRIAVFFEKEIHLGYLVYIFATFFIFVLISYANKLISRQKNRFTSKQVRMANVIYLCSIYTFLFCPLYMFAQDFSRLLRNFSPVNHTIILMGLNASSAVKRTTKSFALTKQQILLGGGYVLYLVYAFYWDIYVYFDTVVIPFFFSNWLLS